MLLLLRDLDIMSACLSLSSEMTTLFGETNLLRYPDKRGLSCFRYSAVNVGMSLVFGLVCVRNRRSKPSLQKIGRFSGIPYRRSKYEITLLASKSGIKRM